MQLLEVTARSVLKGNLSGASLWEHSGDPHTLEKHFSVGTAVTVCSGSFIVVVHSATNSISGFVYVVLQVAFSMNAGTFDVCLYSECKQQWQEPASEKISHTRVIFR